VNFLFYIPRTYWRPTCLFHWNLSYWRRSDGRCTAWACLPDDSTHSSLRAWGTTTSAVMNQYIIKLLRYLCFRPEKLRITRYHTHNLTSRVSPQAFVPAHRQQLEHTLLCQRPRQTRTCPTTAPSLWRLAKDTIVTLTFEYMYIKRV